MAGPVCHWDPLIRLLHGPYMLRGREANNKHENEPIGWCDVPTFSNWVLRMGGCYCIYLVPQESWGKVSV